MTSMGKRWSEPEAGSPGQEVLWLAASEPPTQLLAFLRGRGLHLVVRDDVQRPAPLKLLRIDASTPPLVRAPNLTGRRVAVMHPDPGNADALAQSLRAKGAEVVALSLNPASLQRAELLDPDAVIMEASDFSGSCWEIVRAIWQHPHLRFATVILATPELMGNQQVSALDVQDLSFAVHAVAKDYERIAKDARELDRFAFELESLGPSRSLRALLAADRRLRVQLTSAEVSIEIDLAEQIIVGAQSPAGAAPSEGLLGVHALNLFLAQRTGQVEVRSVDHPAHTNVMAPLDSAMHMARDASSSVRPSAVLRPVVDSREPLREEAATRSKVPLHNRTLIGVPAVQVDPGLLNGKPKTAAGPASVPAASLPRTSTPTRPTKPPRNLPAQAAQPSPASAARTLPPPAQTSEPPTRPAVNAPQGSAPPAPPPLSKAPAPPVASIVVELTLPEKPTQPPARALESPAVATIPASALDTLRLNVVDADAVRAFRPKLRLRLPRRAGWFALAALALMAVLWLLTRRDPKSTGSLALPPAPEFVPHARAAEPPPKASAPAQVAVREPESVVDNAAPVMDVEVGRQNRGNARKASLLSDQGNAFRQKKMFPTARVRYLEALRAYPDYPRALSGLVQLALSDGDPDDALRYARQLVKTRPGQAPYHLLLGDAYRATGDEKEARASYQSAARLGSDAAQERLAK